MDLNKTLAEIAVTGIFEGQQADAENIINALEGESINELSQLSLRALFLMSQEKYQQAADFLEPWCRDSNNAPDIPHAYFGLALWKSGQSEQSKQWCNGVLKNCKDDATRKLVDDVLLQIGA